MYPKHVGHENGGCGHLGRAPLSQPTFGGHSCKKYCMVAPHESRLLDDYALARRLLALIYFGPNRAGRTLLVRQSRKCRGSSRREQGEINHRTGPPVILPGATGGNALGRSAAHGSCCGPSEQL
jgi:hypothetical protein